MNCSTDGQNTPAPGGLSCANTMKLEPLEATPPPKSGDKKLDKLLAALDAPHDDANANAALAEIYDLEDLEAPLRSRLEQVIAGVGPTEMSSLLEEQLPKAEHEKARTHFDLLGNETHQLACHAGRLASAIVMYGSEDADRALAQHFLTHPSLQIRSEIGDALLGVHGHEYDPELRATRPALEMLGAAIEYRPTGHTYDYELRRIAAHAIVMTTPGGGFDRLAPHTTMDAAKRDEYTASAILHALAAHVEPDAIDPRWFPHLAPLHLHPHGPGVSVPYFYKKFLDARALEPLCKVLDQIIDAGRGGIHDILAVLGDLGDTRAVPTIMRVLTKCKYGWEPAIEALQKIGDASPCVDTSIIDELDALLVKVKKKKDKAKKPTPLAKLIKELRAKGEPAKPAKAAKAKKPAKPPPKGVPAWTEPPELVAPATGDKALDKLIADLGDTDRKVAAAMKALTARKDDATTRAIRERLAAAADGVVEFGWDNALVNKLTKEAKGSYRKLHTKLAPAFLARYWLVHRLASLVVARGDREGERIVLDIHLNHANEEIRNAAGFALLGYAEKHTFQHSPSVEPASKETLTALADTLPQKRSVYAAHAAFLVDKEPIDRFAPLLDGDDVEVGNLLHVILRHVGAKSDRRWVDVMIPLLEGEQALLATWILGKIPDKRAVEPLLALIDRQIDDNWVDESAVTALGAIGDRRGVEGMLRVLEHPKMTVQFSKVAEEIRRLGDASIAPRLEALAAQLEKKKVPWRDPKIVKQLIKSLGKQRAQA